MADQEDQGQQEQELQEEDDLDYGYDLHSHWRWLHYRGVNGDASSMMEVQHLARTNWLGQFNATLYDHGVDGYDAEL